MTDLQTAFEAAGAAVASAIAGAVAQAQPSASPAPASGLSAAFFSTGYGGTPEMNTAAKAGAATQMLCLKIGAKQGDLIVATANQEVTNPSPGPAFCWVEFFVSPNATDAAAPLNAEELCGRSGTNITPDQHHYVFNRTGMCRAPVSGDQYVILAITWDPDYDQDGTIEGQGYGKLDALVLSGVGGSA